MERIGLLESNSYLHNSDWQYFAQNSSRNLSLRWIALIFCLVLQGHRREWASPCYIRSEVCGRQAGDCLSYSILMKCLCGYSESELFLRGCHFVEFWTRGRLGHSTSIDPQSTVRSSRYTVMYSSLTSWHFLSQHLCLPNLVRCSILLVGAVSTLSPHSN